MQQILETANIILKEIIALIKEFIALIVTYNLWQLFALLVVLHLLYYLWKMRKNQGDEADLPQVSIVSAKDRKAIEAEEAEPAPAKVRKNDDDFDLLEVDLKPVIVYRKAADKPAPPPTPPVFTPVAEEEEQEMPKQVPAAAAQESSWTIPAPQPELESKPIEPPAWVKALEPGKAPVEEIPSNPIVPQPVAKQQPVMMEPLPLLESDLANDLLRDFRDWGCRFEEVVYQGRFGADVVLSRGGQRIFVQVKEWKKKAGENVIQEVASYRHSQRCELAIIINYAGFERAAEKMADSKGIFLWNKREIERQRKNPTVLGSQAAAAKN